MGANSKQIVDSLIKAMGQRPEDFKIGDCTLSDRRSGMSIWIANGPLSHGVDEPFHKWFGPIQSIRFRLYLNRFKAWKAEALLNQEPSK
jgi:hypothetical protein